MGKASDPKRFLTNLQKILFCLFAFRVRLRFRLGCRRCNFCRLVADIPVFIQFVQKCFMSTIHFWLQIKGTTTFGIVCSEVLVELLHTQQIHLQLLQKEKSDSHPLSSNSEFVTIQESKYPFSEKSPERERQPGYSHSNQLGLAMIKHNQHIPAACWNAWKKARIEVLPIEATSCDRTRTTGPRNVLLCTYNCPGWDRCKLIFGWRFVQVIIERTVTTAGALITLRDVRIALENIVAGTDYSK